MWANRNAKSSARLYCCDVVSGGSLIYTSKNIGARNDPFGMAFVNKSS